MYQPLQRLAGCGWVRSDTTGSLYGIGIRALHTGRVGWRIPAHAGALGKALLAERPDDRLPPPGDGFDRLMEPARACCEQAGRWFAHP